jgi:Arc/MetJ family transcription regulator
MPTVLATLDHLSRSTAIRSLSDASIKHIIMHHLMPVEVHPMRTTLNIDDQLYEEAVRLTGVKEKTALLRESLKALIQRETARRLARLGGSEPQLDEIPRRRSDGE